MTVTPDDARQLVYAGWFAKADRAAVARARDLAYEHLSFTEVCKLICDVNHMLHTMKADKPEK